jgi:hypothetical protein
MREHLVEGVKKALTGVHLCPIGTPRLRMNVAVFFTTSQPVDAPKTETREKL